MDFDKEVAPQFQCEFNIKVPNAAKNGEVVEFFVETLKVGDERAVVVIRVHEDFAWLHHCLKTQDNVVGIIFPPLPNAPVTSLQAAEKRTKKQVGEKAQVLVPDNYEDDCKAHEKFLTLCATHPRLGNSKILHKFLCEKEAPARVKVRRSIFNTFTKAVDDMRLANFKDCDDDLHQSRLSNIANIKDMKLASTKYQNIINSEHRIGSNWTEIYQTCQLPSIEKESKNIGKISQILMEACDHSAEMSKVLATNRQRTLGAAFKLYAGYSDEEHDMLQKRIYKQIDLESAKKTYEKAKPQKKQQAEDNMKKLEKELSEMTSFTKPELQTHHRNRVLAFQSAFTRMVESEIKTARDGLAVFTKQYAELQKLEV